MTGRGAEKALAIAEQLDIPSVRSRALVMRGLACAERGEPGEIDDLRTALASRREAQRLAR